MAKRKPVSKSKTEITPKEESAKLGQPSWSGFISFGLVNIPIKLFSAVREKPVRFHMLHADDLVRVQQKLICPTEQKEISRQETVKGFEVSKGTHVVISKEELATLMPKAQRGIELMSFVDLDHVDPIYFDRPFYILPGEHAGKAYQLLLAALKETGKVGIGKFVMREKEYIAAIRPVGMVLCLETMHFADEVVIEGDVTRHLPEVKISAQELAMARQLVESLEADFEPTQLHDEYREALMALVEKKAAGGEITTTPEADTDEPEVIDLMAALKKSLSEVKKSKPKRAA